MSMKLRAGLLAACVLMIGCGGVIAAGSWSTLPIVGSASFCASTVSGVGGGTANGLGGLGGITGQGQGLGAGSICGQTVPAGPTGLTGEELIPADTGLGGGASPQSVTIPSGLLGSSTNRLIGGDFDTNLAQRMNSVKGLASVAAKSNVAAIITADRWWTITPAGETTVTIDSTASTAVVPALNNTKALRVARTTSGAAGIQCVGQTLDQQASAPLIGNNAVFSFYEESGATAPLSLTVNVDYTSASDGVATQATLGFAGLNGSLFALGDVGLASAGPTNFTRAIGGVSPATVGTVANGVATLPVAAASTWARYAVYAPIPVNVPGTATPVTSVSVSICWTPTATTAVTTDWIEIEGLQLEAKASTPTASLPAGITSPSGFSRRQAADEHSYEYYYWYFNYENQSLVTPVANTSCLDVTTSLAACTLSFPVPMRLTPAVDFTDGFQAFTSTAYTTLGAVSSMAVYTQTITTVPSPTSITFKGSATTTPAAGTANFLYSLGTSSATGIISASAEP